jgi:hypothetical protein
MTPQKHTAGPVAVSSTSTLSSIGKLGHTTNRLIADAPEYQR